MKGPLEEEASFFTDSGAAVCVEVAGEGGRRAGIGLQGAQGAKGHISAMLETRCRDTVDCDSEFHWHRVESIILLISAFEWSMSCVF